MFAGQILRFAEDDSGGGGPSQGRSFAALRMTREGGVFVGQIFRFAQDDSGGGGPSWGRSFAVLRMTVEGAFVGKILRGAQDDDLFISGVILRAQPEGSFGRGG